MYKTSLQNTEGDRLLVNWSRWISSDGTRRGHCGSAEYRFVPDKLTESESEARTARNAILPINPIEAETIDIALRYVQAQVYKFLKKRYHEKRGTHELARIARIDRNLVDHYTDQCLGQTLDQYKLVTWTQGRPRIRFVASLNKTNSFGIAPPI